MAHATHVHLRGLLTPGACLLAAEASFLLRLCLAASHAPALWRPGLTLATGLALTLAALTVLARHHGVNPAATRRRNLLSCALVLHRASLPYLLPPPPGSVAVCSEAAAVPPAARFLHLLYLLLFRTGAANVAAVAVGLARFRCHCLWVLARQGAAALVVGRSAVAACAAAAARPEPAACLPRPLPRWVAFGGSSPELGCCLAAASILVPLIVLVVPGVLACCAARPSGEASERSTQRHRGGPALPDGAGGPLGLRSWAFLLVFVAANVALVADLLCTLAGWRGAA